MKNTTFKFGFRSSGTVQTFPLTSAPLYGYWMRIDDNNAGTATSIDATGELVYGDPPKWFRGVGSYGDSPTNATGLALITDRTEGGADSYASSIVVGHKFNCKLSATGLTTTTFTNVGANGILNLEGAPFPGRYFAKDNADSDNDAMVEAFRTNGTLTFNVEITVLDDSSTTEKLFTTAFVPGRLLDDMTQYMGQAKPSNMYRNLVR